MILPPWLHPVWQRLNETRLRDRLPHALLFSGAAGTGKQMIAEQLAHALLCAAPDAAGQACGKCSACSWLLAGTHPDLLVLQPEEAGKSIKIDDVRALCSSLVMTSHAGRYKVAIIHPAEALNINAANSLLKTLEEPTERTVILLLSARPGRLPATVRSRCQQVPFPVPEQSLACEWLKAEGVDPGVALRCLQLAGGGPLAALDVARSDREQRLSGALRQLQQVFEGTLDPLKVAAEWMTDQEQIGLSGWQNWLEEAIRWKIAGSPRIDSPDSAQLQQIVETVDCRLLFSLADRVANALNSLGSGLNRQLILEDLLISWAGQAKRDSMRRIAKSR
ncbi:MAG: DNA polymerase III subunit delta' [Thiogranum sp.]|nr:DNA polymerase III subunit delta' [Thiogranum sp.]